MFERGQPAMLQVGQEVHKTEAAAQEEHEHRHGRHNPTRSEAKRREIEDARKRKAKHRARRCDRLGERKAHTNEIGGEKVDHEGVAHAVSRIDRILRRKVVAVSE